MKAILSAIALVFAASCAAPLKVACETPLCFNMKTVAQPAPCEQEPCRTGVQNAFGLKSLDAPSPAKAAGKKTPPPPCDNPPCP